MGFAGYLGGRVLCVLAVLLGIFAIAIMLGFFTFVEASLVIPLGIGFASSSTRPVRKRPQRIKN